MGRHVRTPEVAYVAAGTVAFVPDGDGRVAVVDGRERFHAAVRRLVTERAA